MNRVELPMTFAHRTSVALLVATLCGATIWGSPLSAQTGAAQTRGAQAQAAETRAAHVSAEELAATIANAPEDRVSDQQIRHIDAGGMNLGVGVVHRPVTTRLSAIQHHQQAEIYRVVEGRGTLVTSSSLADPTELDPEGNVVQNLTGPSAVGAIENGVSQDIGPGDILFIPAGIAHGFSAITEPITYIVYRIDPDQLVTLKGG